MGQVLNTSLPFKSSQIVDTSEDLSSSDNSVLANLQFLDLIVGKDSQFAKLTGVAGEQDPVNIPPTAIEETSAIYLKCVNYAFPGGNINSDAVIKWFAIEYKNVFYRVSTYKSRKDVVFCLRRQPNRIYNCNELKIHQRFQSLFLRPHLKGLIIVAGGMRNGKTHTAGGILHDRLCKYGGVAFSAENPPELPLEGSHGDLGGILYQTWIKDDNFGEACKDLARSSSSMLYIGELTDGRCVLETLRASLMSTLVITTFHGNSIVGTLERLISLAESALGSKSEVCSMLAFCLTGIIFQELVVVPGNNSKALRMDALWVTGTDEETSIRSLIRGGNCQALVDQINAQRRKSV